ncbi:MAG TPA: hypothetical protein VK778_07150, partial [Solirubrobacteraceae bacterium]|nr:hypothetical protein [Solirubrobacteraceae bacterium]
LSIRSWAAELEAAAVIARQLAPTAFIPESLKRYHRGEHNELLDGKDGRAYRLDLDSTTATAAAAILTGQEIGLKPMAALRSIAVINNTPALAALTLRAVLQNAGHDIWVAESTATRAVVRARRAGDTEVQESTWTLDRAKTLGLYPGKEYGQWRRQPTSMLVARATAEAARWIASDAILGIPYIAEELIDELDEHAPLAIEAGPGDSNGEQPKAKTRTVKRKAASPPPALPAGPPLPRAADEPPAVAAANARAVPEEPADAAPEMITKPQLDKLHAGLREIGISDRDEGLSLVSTWAGRQVPSTAKLTFTEAKAVLDSLDAVRSMGARLAVTQAHDDAERDTP